MGVLFELSVTERVFAILCEHCPNSLVYFPVLLIMGRRRWRFGRGNNDREVITAKHIVFRLPMTV